MVRFLDAIALARIFLKANTDAERLIFQETVPGHADVDPQHMSTPSSAAARICFAEC
jgi:hypothetical protein